MLQYKYFYTKNQIGIVNVLLNFTPIEIHGYYVSFLN
jgi:hypothetical protein